MITGIGGWRMADGSTYTLEETATDVDVQAIGEMIAQVQQTRLNIIHLLRIVNGGHVQIDEPNQTVLIHGIDVSQINCKMREMKSVKSTSPLSSNGSAVYLW